MSITSVDQAKERLELPELRVRNPWLPKLGENILAWYLREGVSHPWRDLWANHSDPYHVWVSEVMLQQTLIKVVIPKYLLFLDAFPNVASLAMASEDDVREAVRGLGYYRRFAFLHKAAKSILRGSGPDQKIAWPNSFSQWKLLPGVGDYTAAALSSITLNAAVPVVDGNVERVFSRIFDIRLPGNIAQLKKMFFQVGLECLSGAAKSNPGDFNQGLMELGQVICMPNNPQCHQCPVSANCQSLRKKSQHLSPGAKVKPANIDVSMRLTIVKYGNKYGLHTRSSSAKFLKEMAGFLTDIMQSTGYKADGHASMASQLKDRKIGQIKHSITRHKITAEVVSRHIRAKKYYPELSWFDADEVEPRLVSNLDRKAWRLFLKN